MSNARQLHLGCGPHQLPLPWENYDQEVNIARPLPWRDRAAKFIFAEHVIEHVTFPQAWAFLHECLRVLDFGGTLRVAFPDVSRFGETGNEAYLAFLKREGFPARDRGDITRFLLTGSGHQAAWTQVMGMRVLESVGFSHVVACEYGRSARAPLAGIDGHHLSSPLEVVLAETTVLEGTR